MPESAAVRPRFSLVLSDFMDPAIDQPTACYSRKQRSLLSDHSFFKELGSRWQAQKPVAYMSLPGHVQAPVPLQVTQYLDTLTRHPLRFAQRSASPYPEANLPA